MFTESGLAGRLPVRGLGSPLYFYETIGSTNDRAAELARQGSPHGTLVVAEEQTRGKGRGGRAWVTRRAAALAFSLVIRPEASSAPERPMEMNMLGALAVAEHLGERGARAEIKWPNDVLLMGRKVAGILTEASWSGDELEWVVLGVGINVRPESVPSRSEIAYPAISLDEGLGEKVDRGDFLKEVLRSLGGWLGKLGTDEFRRAVQDRMAFIGEQVELFGSGRRLHGTLEGIDAGGRLALRNDEGRLIPLGAGEFKLVPRDPDET